MRLENFLATALIVGIIAPLFWLGVGRIDNWVQRNVYPVIRLKFAQFAASLREKVRPGKPRSTARQLGGSPRIGE